MTRGSTCKRGIKCVVANTHGVFHAKTKRRYTQLAQGNRITPQAPEEGRPGLLQGVQDLIAELVAKGYSIVYTDGSSKRPSHKDMRRTAGFGVFAAEDEQGPEVHFCGYVPTRHRQTNNGAEPWAVLEGLQGFWVPKWAILTDSQYVPLGATGRAQH